jgi:tetratricopeptide (TPR) repeat protein
MIMRKEKLSNRLQSSVFLVFLAQVLIASSSARAATDRIRLTQGNESGEVTEMTPQEVTLDKGQAGNKALAVNQIKSIVFEGEPSELTQARVNAANGNFEKAQDMLAKIDLGSVRRDLINQDVEFFKAYSAAQLALGGTGEIVEAGRQLNTFVRTYPKNYHYYEAVQAMGELLMASGRYDLARKQYADVATAPWLEYKMRAAVDTGRSWQAQKNHAEAIKQFDAALAMADASPEAQVQKLAATLGKAVSLAETGKVDEAVGTIEKIIQDADPSDKQLQVRAHLALGSCYEKAGRSKDALYAYLYVDVIYNSFPEAHAEALAHLVPLWQSIGQEERSREARQLLQERYSGSRWAKQLQ